VSARVHVFVLVDALGWRVIEGRRFLEDLLPHRQPLRTVLGYSSGAIPTLLTGRTPAEHGHWNLVAYDPERSPFRWLRRLRFLPDRALDNRVARRVLKEMGRRVLGLGPLFECAVRPGLLPLFDWVERRSIYEAGGVRGARTIFDELRERGTPFRAYSYHRYTDEQALACAQADVARGGEGVYFLYLSELDAFLHRHRHEPQEIGPRLQWYADRLRGVFEAARRRDPEARLSVFSDHGMAEVRREYDLVGAVDALGFRMPDDYLAVYDSTMARFWFFDERARRAVTDLVGHLRFARILDDAELSALGILFPDRRYGELIALFEPGVLLASSGFNGSRWRPAGMHGYHPDDPDSDGVFLASAPPRVRVSSLADVHGTLQEAVS
jgi:hypothetical protein